MERRRGPAFVAIGLAVGAAFAAIGCHTDGGQCPETLARCPATVPANGAPCTGVTAGCEYGDDPQYQCNQLALCGLEGWVVQSAGGGPSCPTSLPAECPASFAEALAPAGCPSSSANETVCRYPEGMCSCQPAQATFTCKSPAGPGCPAARPHAGTPCGPPCTLWGSGTCDGESMKCRCGVWQLVECYD